jgi:hypothetical protein
LVSTVQSLSDRGIGLRVLTLDSFPLRLKRIRSF